MRHFWKLFVVRLFMPNNLLEKPVLWKLPHVISKFFYKKFSPSKSPCLKTVSSAHFGKGIYGDELLTNQIKNKKLVGWNWSQVLLQNKHAFNTKMNFIYLCIVNYLQMNLFFSSIILYSYCNSRCIWFLQLMNWINIFSKSKELDLYSNVFILIDIVVDCCFVMM